MQRPSFVRFLPFLLLVLLALAHAAPAAEAVALPQGRYVAQPPAGWDGRAPLPVVLFFHGAGGVAEDVVTDPDLAAAASDAGVLLVAPEGMQRGWAVPGSPREGLRDEIGFIDAILADLARRYPIDSRHVRVGGFSLGASVAAFYACARGARLDAVLTVAGTFWRPAPEACTGGATNWLHMHGTADTVFPLGGRVVRERFHQGDSDAALAMLARAYGCGRARPAPPIDDAACEEMPDCAGHHAIMSCRHAGGHELRGAWLGDFLRWAGGMSPAHAAR